MVWLAWRQFRMHVGIAAAALAAVVIALAVTRSHVESVYGVDGSHDLTGFYTWLRLLGTGLIGVPAIIGAFWGAPLVAREFEGRTDQMVWTQSITRRRWLTTQLAVTGSVTVVVVGIFALTFTWWTAPIDTFGNRIGTANFAQRGIAPIGYALFGLALGTLIGTMLRRTLPAMAASLAGFFVVRIVIQKIVRQHLLGTESVDIPAFFPHGLSGWTISTQTVDAAGNALTSSSAEQILIATCDITRDTANVDEALASCAHHIGIHDIAQVHPASQFWSLQAAELGLFVAFAAVLAGATFWWLDHRTA